MNGKTPFFALAAVIFTLGTLWFVHREVIPKKATWGDVRREAKEGGYELIGTTELWNRYRTDPKGMLLVDTRQEWEYRTGHIKGAVNFPLEPTGWSRWRNKGDLKKLLGPDKNRFLVFY